MSRKWINRSIIFISITLLIAILVNFGFNFWLKSKLPDLLKNNTDYTINYQSLNIEWETGNIYANKISIATKEGKGDETLKINGTIDSLKVNRLGILDAVFNKIISSSEIHLTNPSLEITLPKHKKHQHQKKETKVKFNNIVIDNGNFNIYRYSGQKIFSAKNLQLWIDNLRLREDRQKDELPFIFDHYSITGNHIFLRPNLSHVILSQNLKTENGTLNIQDFRMVPLLSPKQFERFFPDQKVLIGFSAKKMDLKEVKIEKNKISVSDIFVQNSDWVAVTKVSKKDSVKEERKKLDLFFDKIKLENANVLIKKTDEQPIFSGNNINFQIDQLVRDQKTEKEKIPIKYQNFLVSGKEIFFANQNIELKTEGFASSSKNIVLSQVSAISKTKETSKLRVNLKGKKIQIGIEKLDFSDKKLNLDIGNILLDEINGEIGFPIVKTKQEPDFSNINFPISVKNFSLKNSNVSIEKDKQPIVFNDFNAQIKGIKIALNSDKKLGFSFDYY